jgi:hypothetical protein
VVETGRCQPEICMGRASPLSQGDHVPLSGWRNICASSTSLGPRLARRPAAPRTEGGDGAIKIPARRLQAMIGLSHVWQLAAP